MPSTDNFSDSSGDTTTADSGRGGSDLDLSHPQRQGTILSDIPVQITLKSQVKMYHISDLIIDRKTMKILFLYF